MKRQTTVLLMILFLGASRTDADLYFADGGVHDIDYAISDVVIVQDGPSGHTTVNLLDGGAIEAYLRAYGNSQVNMLGGIIGNTLDAYDNSQVNMSGGTIGLHLYAHGSSHIMMTGGLLQDDLRAYDDSNVNVSGGTITNQLSTYNHSLVVISGGSMSSIVPCDFSQVDIFGGSLLGGGHKIQANHGPSIVNIYGVGFNYGYGAVTATGGTLTGTLTFGQPISWGFLRWPDHEPIIMLTERAIIPLPGAFLLGTLGLSVAAWKLRRRKE